MGSSISSSVRCRSSQVLMMDWFLIASSPVHSFPMAASGRFLLKQGAGISTRQILGSREVCVAILLRTTRGLRSASATASSCTAVQAIVTSPVRHSSLQTVTTPPANWRIRQIFGPSAESMPLTRISQSEGPMQRTRRPII